MRADKMTVAAIRAALEQEEVSDALLAELTCDERPAVVRLLRRREREQAEIERVRALYRYECEWSEKGYRRVAGVDEAGRGPLAGPVVVAAVVLPLGFHFVKLNDSKKLSPKVREALYDMILREAIAVERCVVGEREIDEINIYQATVRGMYAVLAAVRPDAALIDAVPLERLAMPSLSLIKGDAISASIAAASIVAKVERDRLMTQLDETYPQYGFAKHKGYGTAEHLAAIRRFGPCPIHRKSFEPIRSWGI